MNGKYKIVVMADGTKVKVPLIESAIQEVSTSQISTTMKTANIRMIDDNISIFINDYGQRTPLLIVARCMCDGIEYAALYNVGMGVADPNRGKSYVVELVREKGEIKYFRDLDGVGQDEEWGTITNFFLDNNVYERNRINKWIINTRLLSALGQRIPTTMLRRMEALKTRWEKKKMKT